MKFKHLKNGKMNRAMIRKRLNSPRDNSVLRIFNQSHKAYHKNKAIENKCHRCVIYQWHDIYEQHGSWAKNKGLKAKVCRHCGGII